MTTSRLVALLGCIALAACSAQPQEPAPAGETNAQAPRPNIIFILTDDQRYDALGVMNPDLVTPNMDRLAREGVRFENAFVTTSLCSPSRASILTGRPMREHGVVDNNSALPGDLETFPAALQSAGYQTGFIGKWHMGGENADPRPGFDHWVSFAGQGSYSPTTLLGRPSMLNVNGETVPQASYITDELTAYALDWLEGVDRDEPFLLYLSHKAVHAPFRPAERHAEQYSEVVIEDVTPPLDAMDREPMWVQNQRNSWHGADFAYHSTLALPEFQREYRRTLSAVDDSLGEILAWLEESGEADQTLVVLTSDNGFLFGEHGLIDKRNAYEESMRVPMIAWMPGFVRQGAVEPRMVANIDLAPTFRALAGAAPQPGGGGLDMTPLLTGEESTPWRDALVYEYYWEFNYPQTPSLFAIRTDTHKLIRHHGVWDTDALYDLSSDPGETQNRIDDPELLELRLDLARRLHEALGADGAGHAVPYTYKFNQGAVFRHPDRAPAADFPDRWMREDDAPDRVEHFVPDGPNKPAIVERLDAVLSEGEGG